MQKALRKGKVLVDWSQNDAHKTTVNVYSLRAVERSLVSTPVTWEEVRKAIREKRASSLQFEPRDVLRRVKSKGDLFAPVLTVRQKLPSLSALKSAAGESSSP
jgi:bifunctional non-homologous end joining protein LigD